MKPNFALGLTDDGITLWQRGDAGWLRVGAVPMDAPDLDTQMQALVKDARALASEGLTTKLVIPDEQILYTDMPAQADDTAIRAALEGRTPYPVDQIAFDHYAHAGGLRVAVVAHETLSEAEEFARAQGLNPVCFVAAPQDTGFAAEPFFGPVPGVSDSPEALGRGGPILRETGLAEPPEPVQVSQPKATAPAQHAPERSDKRSTATVADKGKAPEPAKPGPERFTFAKRESETATASAKPSKAARKKTARSTAAAPSAPAAAKTPEAQSATSASFRSRRAAPGAAADTGPPTSTTAAPATKALTALAKSRSLSLGSVGRGALAERLRSSVAAPVSRAGSSLRGATLRLNRKPAPAAEDVPAKVPKAAQTAASKPDAAMARKADADPEAERLTVFGARRHGPVSEPKLPRRALAISGAALLLVLAVGVWVFYFTRAQAPDLAQPVLPDETGAEIAAPEALALPDTEDAGTSSEIDAALGVTDAAQQPGGTDSFETAAPDSIASDSASPEVDRPAQRAGRLAALRSVQVIAPVAPGGVPDVQAAPAPYGSAPLPPLRGAADAEMPTSDTVAEVEPGLPPGEEVLDITVTQGPPVEVPPVRPEGIAPAPPPAPAQPLDESALVIDVTNGAPPSVPPDRPASIAPAAPDSGADAAEPEDQASLAPPPGGVALDIFAPRQRPTDIVEDAAAQAAQFASATPQAVAASLRPSDRPEGFSQTVQRLRAEIVQAAAAAVAPRIPSSASVTRAATEPDALNLRQVNLLGVVGKPSARRALVRLDNGRVVTVQVGARLDGGEVTAIGEDELRYTRRGRNVVLRIAS